MKNIAILWLVMFVISCTHAQKESNKSIPSVVQSALQNNYPNAKEIKWEKEKTNYEVEFEVEGTDYSVLVDVSGNILETEIEIKTEELPAEVKNYIAKNHTGQKIKEATKITDNNGVVTYETEVKDKDLIFDSNGNFLKELKD